MQIMPEVVLGFGIWDLELVSWDLLTSQRHGLRRCDADAVDHLVVVGHRHRRRTRKADLRGRLDPGGNTEALNARVLLDDGDTAGPEGWALGQLPFDPDQIGVRVRDVDRAIDERDVLPLR